jgi:quercetin dioxygenase-like cupin family protein
VKRNLTTFAILTSVLLLIPCELQAREQQQVKVERLLQTTQSWDGSRYVSYPKGQPQITVLKITVPPFTKLHWHHHPVINAAYLVSGQLTVETKNGRERQTLRAGQVLPEMVQTVHRGFTKREPAELIVFYAGQVGVPVTVND